MMPERRAGPRGSPAKRLLDVVLATCVLVAMSPLMACIAAVIRITMGAPVLFRQTRPGLDGRPFVILKFRTMTAATEEGLIDDAERDLASHQARTSRIGGILRKTSLDELPELWNVLRGDMSLVGPRPLLMEYLPHYSPEQMSRHDTRPGVTGLAQVSGRHSLDWETRFRYDSWYVKHWSLRLDARIMIDTLKVILSSSGQGEFEAGSQPPRFDLVATGASREMPAGEPHGADGDAPVDEED